MMKITRNRLIRLIKETITSIVVDDVHEVPDNLEDLSPYEAYGLGHEAGMKHSESEALLDDSIYEFVDGSYGMRGRTVPMGAIINEDPIEEVAPPGMKDDVEALKKDHPDDVAFKIAWSNYNKKNKK